MEDGIRVGDGQLISFSYFLNGELSKCYGNLMDPNVCPKATITIETWFMALT